MAESTQQSPSAGCDTSVTDLDAMRLVGNVLRADNYALHRFHGR